MQDKQIYQYIIVIRNQHTAVINIFGLLLCFISLVFFSLEQSKADNLILPYIIGITFIAGLLLWNIYKHFYTDRQIFFSRALLIAGLVWTSMPFMQWLVFVFVILAILEYQAKHSMEIGFSPNEIVFNTLIKKRFRWNDLTNVILKDGLLTIDFRNNRIFQREIDAGEHEAGEEEFNAWCRQQLNN